MTFDELLEKKLQESKEQEEEKKASKKHEFLRKSSKGPPQSADRTSKRSSKYKYYADNFKEPFEGNEINLAQ